MPTRPVYITREQFVRELAKRGDGMLGRGPHDAAVDARLRTAELEGVFDKLADSQEGADSGRLQIGWEDGDGTLHRTYAGKAYDALKAEVKRRGVQPALEH